MPTKIAWTEETWNPIVGCSHASAGCKNCYAEKMAHRQCHLSMARTRGKGGIYAKVINGLMDHPKHGKWNGKTVFVESALEKPLHWKTPRNIFVCSMSDLFHETVPFEWIDKVFAVMALCPQHTFQVLTKRPERMAEYFAPFDVRNLTGKGKHWPYKNTMLGVTAENQEQADIRIPILLQIPAALRFVSVEPMLGLVDLRQYLGECLGCGYPKKDCVAIDRTQHISCCPDCKHTSLSWVIIGAESGPKRRKCSQEWVHDLEMQCKGSGTPVFIKQVHNPATGKVVKDLPGWPREMPEGVAK